MCIIKKIVALFLCATLVVFLGGCSFNFPYGTAKQSSVNSPGVTVNTANNYPDTDANAESFEERELSLEEYLDSLNDEFATMSNEERKEADLEGVNFKFKIKENNVLIMQFWEDGIAGLVYRASTGDADALAEYDEILISNRDESIALTEEVVKEITDKGYRISNVEYWIMNDVNPDNTLAIIKNGQVVYDTVYGINLIDLGSATK